MIELFSLFSPTKTAPPQEKLFSEVEAGKQLYLGNNMILRFSAMTSHKRIIAFQKSLATIRDPMPHAKAFGN